MIRYFSPIPVRAVWKITVLVIALFTLLFEKSTGQESQLSDNYFSHLECDRSLIPIVWVHGFMAAGDTYEKQALRFIQNGWCPNHILIFDWNTIGRQDASEKLAKAIDDLLKNTGHSKVFLVGHSAGSRLSHQYASVPENAKKLAGFVQLAGFPGVSPAGPNGEVPTLNVFSDGDAIVQGDSISGAVNHRFEKKDHYQVATSEKTFKEMFHFFTGQKPPITTAPESPLKTVWIGGRAVSLGLNSPMKGAEIKIYKVDGETGFRKNEQPVTELTTDSLGMWGPFEASKGMFYEFVLLSGGGENRNIHYFRLPFYTDNPFVYLRALPPPSSMAGMMLSGLPRDEEQSIVSVFISDRAVIHGRDQLRVNDTELSTSTQATASASNIAWFLYDANNNKQSDLEPIPTFQFAPFLTGIDVFFPAAPPETITAYFNGKKLSAASRSSKSGIIVMVFD